jgi:hypothetical protein
VSAYGLEGRAGAGLQRHRCWGFLLLEVRIEVDGGSCMLYEPEQQQRHAAAPPSSPGVVKTLPTGSLLL